MTREERLQKQREDVLLRLKADRQMLERIEGDIRAADRQALHRRQLAVGKLAQQAGLLAWEDATLEQLFGALATLLDTPNPVAVLEGYLVGASCAPSAAPLPATREPGTRTAQEGLARG